LSLKSRFIRAEQKQKTKMNKKKPLHHREAAFCLFFFCVFLLGAK